MECQYGHEVCANLDEKCYLCVGGNQYKEPKGKKTYGIKKNHNKTSKRMGSTFEANNHKQNNAVIKDIVSTGMTPNSGAGKVKGDEQIRGIINIMEELKTQEVERARGHKQFTVKREWLDKLVREANAENMEFWYLKFAFKDTDTESFVVIDTQHMMDMVATMVNDRKISKEADAKVNVAEKRRQFVEAENTKLFAEIEYLKAILEREKIDY
jgi:hypothetical protein